MWSCGDGMVVVVDGGVVVLGVDGLRSGPTAGSGSICTVASTALTLGTARAPRRVGADHHVEAERPTAFVAEELAPGLARDRPLQDARAEVVGGHRSAQSIACEEWLRGACGVVLEQHDEHVVDLELVDGAAREVAGVGWQRDRRHVHDGVRDFTRAAPGGPSAPVAVTSPNAGRRNTRPSNPAGGLTETPWAFNVGLTTAVRRDRRLRPSSDTGSGHRGGSRPP